MNITNLYYATRGKFTVVNSSNSSKVMVPRYPFNYSLKIGQMILKIAQALNINSCHSPTKFLQPANLTTYTILSLFSLQVELAPRLLSS